jgi:hypothetical protein
MKNMPLIFSLAICIFLLSCQKDFSVVTDKGESYAIYSLLNLKDSANYVRINRIYISDDDPEQYIDDPDSVNIRAEDFQVTLQPYQSEDAEEIIVLNPSNDYIKDQGPFAIAHYQTFKTTQQLQPGQNYLLTVRNKLTGFEMHAETHLLGSRTIEYSFKEVRYTTVNQYVPELLDYNGDLGPGQWDKRIYRFLYYEFSGNETRMKYVDWRIDYDTDTSEAKSTSVCQLSDDFLKYLAAEIKADTSVSRKAVGVDKMIFLNDDALTVYIAVHEEQSSGHYIPDFTNFDKGTGILASRYYYTSFAMKLKNETLDSLAYGRFTGNLGFTVF